MLIISGLVELLCFSMKDGVSKYRELIAWFNILMSSVTGLKKSLIEVLASCTMLEFRLCIMLFVVVSPG